MRTTALFLTASLLASAASYQARIRRTDYGIPHIEAKDLGSLGFGEGWAQAEDHLCTILDQVIKVRGERARYFGPGRNNEHIHSDVAMRALRIRETGAKEHATAPAELKEWMTGFATGLNEYLARTGKAKVGGWCRDADWVGPVTPEDLVAVRKGFVMQLPAFALAIATAGPAQPRASADAWPRFDSASNGWAIGRDRSAGGSGMLLANPHYPWVGANRFWEKHLVVPGKLNVYGVSLIGSPGVAIGFNDHVAWTHTVSAGTRIVFYALDLVPGKPTTYRYGGAEREMEARKVKVEVKGSAPVERTVWFSHYGPMLNMPQMGWTASRAVTARDANESNEQVAEQWLAMTRARSMKELQAAHERYQSMPWVNTIATSREGSAWYIDSASTPNLTKAALEAWGKLRVSDPWSRGAWQRGQVLLNGSDPIYEWAEPRLVPYPRQPQLERTDYVFNANDSYWLANSRAPLNGDYSPLHGPGGERSLRTQNNDLTLSNATPDKPAGEDGKFTLDEMGNAILSNRSLAVERLLPELVERCQPVAELAEPCRTLAGWNGRYDLDSRGPALFREWLLGFQSPAQIFATPWSASDPVNTPRGLAVNDVVLKNLARAADLLGTRMNVPLGELQYANKCGERIGVHGGHHLEGVMNMMSPGGGPGTTEPTDMPVPLKGSRWLSDKGYAVGHGSSFLMALEFTRQGPRAKAFLTYGQSGDPDSEHFRDQTRLFARKQWRPVLFQPAEIKTATRREYRVTGPRRP